MPEPYDRPVARLMRYGFPIVHIWCVLGFCDAVFLAACVLRTGYGAGSTPNRVCPDRGLPMMATRFRARYVQYEHLRRPSLGNSCRRTSPRRSRIVNCVTVCPFVNGFDCWTNLGEMAVPDVRLSRPRLRPAVVP